MFLAKAFQTDVRPLLEAGTLFEMGYPLHVLAWDRYSEFHRYDNLQGATVRSFSCVNLRNSSRFALVLGAIIFQAFLVLESVRLVNKHKRRPIVHAHDFNTLLPACLLKIIRLAACVVYDYRELTYAVYAEWFNPIIGSIARVIEERHLKYADAIITVCEPLKRYVDQFNRNAELVYNCMREAEVPKLSRRQLRKQLGLPLDAFIVSYVGEIRYGCKLDLMLAAALLCKQRVHFLVVGGGPLSDDFRKAAGQVQNGRISVVPYKPRRKALLYVKASDLSWVIYSKSSLNARISMPRKLLESLKCGIPVVVDRGTLGASVVKEHRCGIVLENQDPNYVSREIISLAENSRRRADMSTAAKRVSQEFTWENASRKMVNAYLRSWQKIRSEA
jgi:glycosyltransferase involved in cell wall biosynthesis